MGFALTGCSDFLENEGVKIDITAGAVATKYISFID